MVEELIALLIMASALGMDAFSIALGMGTLGLRYSQMFKVGLTIGVFHVIMPLMGMVAGKLLSAHLGLFANWLGAGLLLWLGLVMIVSPFQEKERTFVDPSGIGLFVFALSVSLDSLSAGLSLGMVGAKMALAVVAMGVMSTVLSWLGLFIGMRFQRYVGSYSELLGGFILCGFGVKLLLPY